MKKSYLFTLVIVLFISTACFSQNKKYTPYEKECMTLFNDYISYMKNAMRNNVSIRDSLHLKYVIVHYLFFNSKLDTAKLATTSSGSATAEKLNILKKELNTFYQFLLEREKKSLAQNLTAMPLRLSSDKYIYNRLTSFQKKNTFILYDKRTPGHTLGYMLFMPPEKNIIAEPRIWSWTLMFKFGKYMFKSVTGEEGYEYMFSREKFKN